MWSWKGSWEYSYTLSTEGAWSKEFNPIYIIEEELGRISKDCEEVRKGLEMMGKKVEPVPWSLFREGAWSRAVLAEE